MSEAGGEDYLRGVFDGLMPDPDMWINEWADEFMRIPRGNGAEPGKYHTARTPYAKRPMQCLSPAHPCRRVVARVASQLLKTQIGINWLAASIHQAPANMLVLLPTGGVAKRVSSRISKTIEEVPVVRELVAPPRSRDSRNTMDTKEFAGGTMFITTAGSAANLAETPARYVYGDEVDRWDTSVDKEGDPVDLAEARTSTFGRNAKIYFSASPTIEGESRIDQLFNAGTQEHYYVPCPHCGYKQTLIFERLVPSEDYTVAHYTCVSCGVLFEETHKTKMLADGEWIPHATGDGETISFTLSALYAPLGWTSWPALCRQHQKAKELLERGNNEPMQVFYNTRLGICWNNSQERTSSDDLRERAEDYRLRTVPEGAVIITAAVDVQHNRLELQIDGWGLGMENWGLDYQVIYGDPASSEPWDILDGILLSPLLHARGHSVPIMAAAIDSGGHHTHEVYQFCRTRKRRRVMAVKGSSRPGRDVIAARPSKMDVKWQGEIDKKGVDLWFVGTDTAKDWISNRWKLKAGAGARHFSNDLPAEYFDQLVAERKQVRYVRGFKRSEWVKGKGDRNEAFDLTVYNLAMAHFLGLHRFSELDWALWMDKLTVAGKSMPQPAAAVENSNVKADKNNSGHWQPKGAGYKPRTR